MKKLFFILLTIICFNLKAQEVIWDQGVPVFQGDKYIDSLTEKVDLIKIRDSKDYELSSEEKSTCVEIGLALYSRREFDAANWYFNKSINATTQPVESKISAEKEYAYLIKEVPVIVESENKKEESEISEIKKDLSFLKTIPKSLEKLSKKDLSKLKKQLQIQIDKLIFEKDSLLKAQASQEVIDAKDGAIKTLKKESEIIDLTIENEDLNVENKDLEVQKKELKKYLLWSIIGITLLVLAVIAVLQRNTIKIKDTELEKQFKDISKKNTYLEHAARIIRHDMHSGINTYMPRGVNSLEKRLSSEDFKTLKLDVPFKMIKDGLSHTQRVYKSVYEFTNLVKQNVVLEKKEVDLGTIILNYLENTSYNKQVEIESLITTEVNEVLFCNAIDNLIRNGLKYNDSEDKKIKIFMEGNYLIVEDNGRGLSKKEFEEICNSYKKTKDKQSETGLGLNISLAILNEHGFNLTCEKLKTGTKMKIKIK